MNCTKRRIGQASPQNFSEHVRTVKLGRCYLR